MAGMNGKRLCAIGLLGTTLWAGAAQAQETTKIRFVLDWKFEGQQSQFTVPLEDGTFQRTHLGVTMDRGAGSGDTVTKVASGAYDMGYADPYAMVRFNGANPDRKLIIVAVNQDKSAIGVATMAKNNILKPQDFNGRKIAAPADAGRQLFPVFAALNQIDAASIQWNSVSPDLRDTLLVRGQADAVTGNLTTVIMDAEEMGVAASELRPFFFYKYGVPLYGASIITTSAFAEAHPQAVKDFIRGIVHGMNVMITDPKTALASVKKHDPLLDDAIELKRIDISLEYMLISDNVLQNGYSNVDMARLQQTLDQVAPAFELPSVPKAAEVYTDRYLPPRDELKIAPWHPRS